MSGSQQDAAAESPSGLVARARSLLVERGAPMNAENLNRAMLMMRGGPDEGFAADVAESAASTTPRTARSRPVQAGSTGVTPPPSATPGVGNIPTETPPSTAAVPPPSVDNGRLGALGISLDGLGFDPMTATQAANAPAPGTLPTVTASTAPQAGPAVLQQMSSLGLSLDPMGGMVLAPMGGGTTGATGVTDTAATAPTDAATPSTAPTSAAAATVEQAQPDAIPTADNGIRLTPQGQSVRNYIFGADGTDEVTGLPRSMVDTILGANRGMSLRGGAPTPSMPPNSVNPPYPGTGGTPRIGMTNQVDRMNVPTTMTPVPPGPPTGIPGGPSPMLPAGPGGAIPLPGASTPTMIGPPPATPRVGGPPNRARLQTDRGNPGRTQDTASQRSKAISDELRNRNRGR